MSFFSDCSLFFVCLYFQMFGYDDVSWYDFTSLGLFCLGFAQLVEFVVLCFSSDLGSFQPLFPLSTFSVPLDL